MDNGPATGPEMADVDLVASQAREFLDKHPEASELVVKVARIVIEMAEEIRRTRRGSR